MIYRQFRRNRSAIAGLLLVALFLGTSLFGPLLAPQDPSKQNLRDALVPPGPQYWLGTDYLGRDLLSRLLHASRVSLVVGLFAVAFGAAVGTFVGLTAGFYGGPVDVLAMRLIDILLSFPGILLALAITSALGPGIANVVLAVGIASFPIYARVVRGAVLRIRNAEFVVAAEAVGVRPGRIMLRHLLPNCVGPLVVQTTLRFAGAILTSSGLSFLGLGIPRDIPEWGNILATGRVYLRSASWVALCPGISLAVVVLGFNLMGDGLRDALDPKLRL